MTADLLKRLVRAIATGSQSDLDRLAVRIIADQRRLGHQRLAEELEALLKRAARTGDTRPVDSPNRALTQLPKSRRHGDSLVAFVPSSALEHHMVLARGLEARFSRIETEFAARDRLGVYGLRPRQSILLYGPPGCGKSLGAKRLAWNLGLPLIRVQFDALLSSFFGESAANLRSVFVAAQQQPCVLLLDECDAIARPRTDNKDIGEAARIVNTLLQLMEDYDGPGLLVATTNIEGSLDPALFRRFDDAFYIPPPGPSEIQRLLNATLSAVEVSHDVHWEEIVDKLTGYSAAIVVKTARDAAKSAILSGDREITGRHLHEAAAELHQYNRVGDKSLADARP